MNPERPPAEEEVEISQIDELDYKEERRPWPPFDPRRIFLGVLAILMILASLLWIGQGVGLLAAILPVGLFPYEGWLWISVGLLGVALLIIVIRAGSFPRWWK